MREDTTDGLGDVAEGVLGLRRSTKDRLTQKIVKEIGNVHVYCNKHHTLEGER